jgi:UDP-glucose 4-epimerase
MAKKILVTGGTGYIGSHTVVELQNEGFEVVIIDNLHNSDLSVLDGIESITGKKPAFWKIDLCDKHKLRSFFEKHNDIEAVIHFAALKSVGESVSRPLYYYHNNILSQINMLDMMKEFSIRGMVFSSSCTVYGQPDKLPVDEQSPVKEASSPYGYTKQVGEKILSECILSSGHINGISLRYFNPIGAHPSALIGELPRGVPDNLVPFITQTGMGIREQLLVFGDDYNTPDGSCIRDYLHVVDLARAHVFAVNRLLENKGQKEYEVFNLGTGSGVSVFEAISSFEKVSGRKLNYSVTSRREGDIEKIWADPAYANKELGWKTELSLDQAMASAWDWEQYYRKTKKESNEKDSLN